MPAVSVLTKNSVPTFEIIVISQLTLWETMQTKSNQHAASAGLDSSSSVHKSEPWVKMQIKVAFAF
ncbi:MAG: hypothetical protein CFE32_17790 [Alphaproteobacteria bacterium PA3]|nr:MAG: hypothetical protein CFE32_17790 [Alphaproteobacteria bacterium PA3]